MDGVDATEQLAAALGKGRVLGGVVAMLGALVAPGHVQSSVPASVHIGELDGHVSARVARLAEIFARSGIAVEIVPDVVRSRWEKLMLVGPWSAIGALARAPLGVIRALPETRALLEGAMREVAAVARASGSVLPDDAVPRALELLDAAPRAAMGNLRDVLECRPSELETEVGTIVRRAREAGIDVPIHDALYAALLPQELIARGAMHAQSLTSKPGRRDDAAFAPNGLPDTSG
jgi:2-dehydropantoate 2-reductase